MEPQLGEGIYIDWGGKMLGKALMEGLMLEFELEEWYHDDTQTMEGKKRDISVTKT